MLKQALRFDVFRIVQDRERHLTPATSEGAVVSAVTIVLMALLILYETVSFFRADIRTSMTVDSNSFHKEPVNFNITFTKIPCSHMVVEIFDPQTGARIPELSNSIEVEYSRVLQESPSVVVGQYHPNMGMLNLNPTAPLEGCRMAGHFLIDKVPGNFYLAGQRNMDIRRMPPSDHIIHELWIGQTRMDLKHDHIPESLANGLGGVRHMNEDPAHTLYQYFLQIVPTYFENTNGKVQKIGYQYTATFSKAQGPESLPPGVYFRHVHTPLAVEYRWEYQSWSHFLVNICAVVGGVYTVMGFVATWLESVTKTVAPVVSRRMRASAAGKKDSN
jgi:hypothetical protein